MELIFPILLVFLVGIMFLSVRRQKKAAADAKEMQENLQIGARIQTTSGMYGTIAGLADGTVDLEIADGVVTRWNRLAIREVVHADDLADSYPGVGLIDPDFEANGIHDDDEDLDALTENDDHISLDKSRGDQDKA
ncbi:preprotein translocase subunit YajC [Williamsia soli]|uniref:preprotein translocase subunit YajC n=1 Tax=Williamsia soli TaxID=364929 RepID=UPI001EFFF3D9|nr:preprotein translocase subunit YajC [Williamsia soli]